MNIPTTINTVEIEKFARLAGDWWDKEGPLKTLHDLNPVRLEFIGRHQSLFGKRVLDVGCGGGILSEAMALQGALVTGIDAGEEAVATASAHASNAGLAIDYACVPVENYQSRNFDIITCMELLEHVDNPQMIINHCANRLLSGGTLFLSTINRTLEAYAFAVMAAEYILGLLPRQTHDYQKFITPAELARMARKAGLEVRDIKGIAYNPFTRFAKIQDSVSVNYIMVCVRP